MKDSSPSQSSTDTSVTQISNPIENNVEITKAFIPITAKVSNLISTCRICLSSIFKPAVLTCGHSFCEQCLEQYWRIREKPSCIICPLCRACAFNVAFTKDEKARSTDDFRKTFSPVKIMELNIDRLIMLCIKTSAIMPALYFLVKWLHPTFAYIFSLSSYLTNKT